MSDHEDPEVVADLRLRAATTYDASRTKPDISELGTFRPDQTVAQWKCRKTTCKGFMDVTQDGLDRFDDMNRILARRGEPLLKSYEVGLCDRCAADIKQERSYRLYEKVQRLASLIRELKEHPKPRAATELLERIRKHHHPDIPGLLDAIEQGRGSKAAKRQRGGDL